MRHRLLLLLARSSASGAAVIGAVKKVHVCTKLLQQEFALILHLATRSLFRSLLHLVSGSEQTKAGRPKSLLYHQHHINAPPTTRRKRAHRLRC
jgi:hypothetical protein